MTQGILLFAHDNEQIQYSLLAAWQAKKIHKWLNRPVSLVTDQTSLDTLKRYKLEDCFDHIILSSATTDQQKNYAGQKLTFKNVDRVSAYDLTPYDETLVMDTDIVVHSDRLNLVWGSAEDYLVCKHCKHVQGRTWTVFDHVSYGGIEFFWATLFYFKKTNASQKFFDLCKHIKENYKDYIKEYRIRDSYLRNDHVWSIAVNALGANTIPTTLWYGLDTDPLTALTHDTVVVGNIKIQGQDVHVMDKFGLIKQIKQELGCE
jgi:hypothetical protein